MRIKLKTPTRLGVFAFFSFSLFSCQSAPPPGMTDPGALIYYGYFDKDAQCSRCHGDEGQGGMFGPQIRDAVPKFGVDKVRDIISYGKGKGDKKMPDFLGILNEAQIEQVIRFLRTWGDTARVDSTGIVQ
jgi:mono/diheme cytochrome c family protein